MIKVINVTSAYRDSDFCGLPLVYNSGEQPSATFTPSQQFSKSDEFTISSTFIFDESFTQSFQFSQSIILPLILF